MEQIPVEYAGLSYHNINPITWVIETYEYDGHGGQFVNIKFLDSGDTDFVYYEKISIRYLGDKGELKLRMDDLCDKIYYEKTHKTW